MPAGTSGGGEVIHAAKAGLAGRAGELILAARYLACGDARIPLGHLRLAATGRNNSGATGAVNAGAAGAAVLASIAGVGSMLAFLISGGQVVVPRGTPAQARVTADVPLTPAQQQRCVS